MASSLPTIQPFDGGNNPSESWRYWKQDFEDYIEALKYSNELEKTKTALFRHVCGEELKKQLRAFNIVPEEGTSHLTLKQILDEFDRYFKDYQNEIYASFKFLELRQERGEKFSDYYLRLRSAVLECNYGDLMERMLRDKIIQGLLNKPLQERLIRETSKNPKTLQEVVSECKTAEHSRAQATEMNVNKVSVEQVKFHATPNRVMRYDARSLRDVEFTCRACGKSHEPRNCPAFGTICHRCKGKNHWSKVCKTKITIKNNHIRRVNIVEQAAEESDPENVFLGELKRVDTLNDVNLGSVWLQTISVNENLIAFKLDTGAQVNVIPKNVILKWNIKPVITENKQPVLDYSDNEVPILGKCELICKTSKVKKRLKFLVTSLNSCPILGLQACKELGLIKRLNNLKELCNQKFIETPEQVLNEFIDVFEGVGKLNRTVSIKLKKNYLPQVAAPRKVPLALHNKVKEELQRMVDTCVITKVDEPTEWVSNMVIVNTPKKLRICLDPRPLNEAILRPHYPIPSADNLLSKLQGCKVFTILDAKNGFWQLPLDEASSYLTTFTTPWGRYRFKVLPFGLNNAPEEFQRAMDEIFENDPEVNPYFDDIALGSVTIADHCQLLRQTLTLARKANLKLNLDKTQLALSSVSYLGHVMSDKGIQPDPRKVRAISEFAAPKCCEDLQRFLGMITYLSKFTPNLSNLTHSLRQLLKQDTEWLWDENTQRDFELIKKTIIQAPCLQYFDDNKPVTLSVDASRNGLGAVLLQDNRPIAYGSASLTETQQRYAQIEKELLAIIYGLEHFNYYTYGRPILVQTDHKPLLGLRKKHYDVISPRLQRMLLRLNRYNIDLVYVPGNKLLIADALSRAQLPQEKFEDDVEEEMVAKVCLLAHATDDKWKEYSRLTYNDAELQDVLYHVENGWPNKHNTRKAAQAYWHCRDELYCTKDGVICRGQRLIVPSDARLEILQKLHISHKGIVACKAKAREYFYWPAINKDVEEYIGRCKICQKHQHANQKEVLLDLDLPDRPWQKVACDFFYLGGQQFLLMIDYFSKYIEVQLMSSTTAQSVIRAFKSIFARHGIPEEMISDGGPPFNSNYIRAFFKEWGICHNITSPYFPRANGQVERAVQTLKKSLIKAQEDGKDLYVVLLDYRIQPSNDLPSPAELLMGRRLRSFLPSHPERLRPMFPVNEAIKKLKKRQEDQKKYANRCAKKLPELKIHSKVWFRWKPNEPWKPGSIVQIGPEPRSYIIKGEEGGMFRRNRYYIRSNNSINKDIELTRTVEDLYPSYAKSVPADNIDEQSCVSKQQTLRRSARVIIKPHRYRDL